MCDDNFKLNKNDEKAMKLFSELNKEQQMQIYWLMVGLIMSNENSINILDSIEFTELTIEKIDKELDAE